MRKTSDHFIRYHGYAFITIQFRDIVEYNMPICAPYDTLCTYSVYLRFFPFETKSHFQAPPKQPKGNSQDQLNALIILDLFFCTS